MTVTGVGDGEGVGGRARVGAAVGTGTGAFVGAAVGAGAGAVVGAVDAGTDNGAVAGPPAEEEVPATAAGWATAGRAATDLGLTSGKEEQLRQ